MIALIEQNEIRKEAIVMRMKGTSNFMLIAIPVLLLVVGLLGCGSNDNSSNEKIEPVPLTIEKAFEILQAHKSFTTIETDLEEILRTQGTIIDLNQVYAESKEGKTDTKYDLDVDIIKSMNGQQNSSVTGVSYDNVQIENYSASIFLMVRNIDNNLADDSSLMSTVLEIDGSKNKDFNIDNCYDWIYGKLTQLYGKPDEQGSFPMWHDEDGSTVGVIKDVLNNKIAINSILR